MESFIKAGHIEPSVIIFDVFGTLVKIEKRRSPYRKLMKWLKDNGRQPQPDDAKFIKLSLKSKHVFFWYGSGGISAWIWTSIVPSAAKGCRVAGA